MTARFIFGFGATVVQKVNIKNEDGDLAYGIGLIDTGVEHEIGSVPSEEEQIKMGIDEDGTIAASGLGALLWFRTKEQRDRVADAMLGK